MPKTEFGGPTGLRTVLWRRPSDRAGSGSVMFEKSGSNRAIIAMWGPRSIAKMVNITPISLWFMVLVTIVTGAYKPTYNWGASHCSHVCSHTQLGLNLQIEVWMNQNISKPSVFGHVEMEVSHFMGVTPSHPCISMLFSDFPWNKPTSVFGDPHD